MLIISKNDIFYKEWSSELKKSVISRISPRDIIAHLWDPVKLVNNVTLKRIFDIVEQNVEFWTIVIQEPIREIIKESSVPSSDLDKTRDSMKYLEIGWDVENDNINIHISTYFSGINPDEATPYTLEFTPSNELINFKLKLNPEFIIYDTVEIGRELNLGSRNFFLIDIIKGIFYELETTTKIQSMTDMINMIRNKFEVKNNGYGKKN